MGMREWQGKGVINKNVGQFNLVFCVQIIKSQRDMTGYRTEFVPGSQHLSACKHFICLNNDRYEPRIFERM